MGGGPVVLPLLLLGVVALGMPRRWLARTPGQVALVLLLGMVVARYLWWRLTMTVWPIDGGAVQDAYAWTIFAVETLIWIDTAILLAMLLRRTDRRAEADRGEVRLRALRPAELPTVDVLIATYDEPLDVLERTIAGALALDWPADRIEVYVLDDGNRDWLRRFCEAKGAGYLTRPDNRHAKAGNINAAIARTSGEFFLVLDADFIPQRRFLYRAIGLFDDPAVGIVQVPQSFFNHGPIQTNLALQKVMPDDQLFFFEAVQPGRDGWDCAFCCGSNSITRRRAIEAAGGALPTGSVTEDIMLTLMLLRHGYVTRYLSERLAIGLAPESLAAFFVQRVRWAQGSIQMMFLRDGPFGPGLTLRQRLLFVPSFWLVHPLGHALAIVIPPVFLLTGLTPFDRADLGSVLSYQVPAILGAILTVRLLAPKQFFLPVGIVIGVLTALRVLSAVLTTLVQPHGHVFRVTPKGAAVGGGSVVDRPTCFVMLGLVAATGFGLLLNAGFNTRVVGDAAVGPVVAVWAVLNMLVLLVVAAIAITPPRLRAEERFLLDEPCRLLVPARADAGADVREGVATVRDLSMSGALVQLDPDPDADAMDAGPLGPGTWLAIEVAGVGKIAGVVRRVVAAPDGLRIGLQFDLPVSQQRNALLARIYTEGIGPSTKDYNAWAAAWGMLQRIVRSDAMTPPPAAPRSKAPAPVVALCAEAGAASSTISLEDWAAAQAEPPPKDRAPLSSAA